MLNYPNNKYQNSSSFLYGNNPNLSSNVINLDNVILDNNNINGMGSNYNMNLGSNINLDSCRPRPRPQPCPDMDDFQEECENNQDIQDMVEAICESIPANMCGVRPAQHRREVIRRNSNCPGRVATIRRRLASPEPDTVERVTLISTPQDHINVIIEKPSMPRPCVMERQEYVQPMPPVVHRNVVCVQPRNDPCGGGGSPCGPCGSPCGGMGLGYNGYNGYDNNMYMGQNNMLSGTGLMRTYPYGRNMMYNQQYGGYNGNYGGAYGGVLPQQMPPVSGGGLWGNTTSYQQLQPMNYGNQGLYGSRQQQWGTPFVQQQNMPYYSQPMMYGQKQSGLSNLIHHPTSMFHKQTY